MATGKTNSRYMRMLLDAYDVSGDARAIDGVGETFREDDATGWSDSVINYTLGPARVFIDGFQAVFNNTASTGSHTVLSPALESYGSLFIGIRAAPAVGDPTFSMPLHKAAYTISGEGPVFVNINTDVGQTGSLSVGGLPMRPWGKALAIGASMNSTVLGTSIDNAVSSANGALAYLHLTASSGGTWVIAVQHSADGGAWSDLISFSANGSAIAAEQGTATGTVNRYVRFRATRTSGTLTAWCAFIRL